MYRRTLSVFRGPGLEPHVEDDDVMMFPQWLSLCVTLSSSVQHEEYGAGAALPPVWGAGEAARAPAVSPQRVSAVCGGGAGTAGLSSPRPPSWAALPGLHTQHPIATTGSPTCAKDAGASGPRPEDRYGDEDENWEITDPREPEQKSAVLTSSPPPPTPSDSQR